VRSVRDQVYDRWELLAAVPDEVCGPVPADARIRLLPATALNGRSPPPDQVRGDFVCWLDQGDVLEPHALYRFADAALTQFPDLVYSDEAITGADLSDIRSVTTRPQFCYDHYLCRPYFHHLVALSSRVLRAAAAHGRQLDLARPDAAVLNGLEYARRVTHVPDYLYRQRGLGGTSGDVGPARARAVEQHLRRIGCPAQATVASLAEGVDVRYDPPPGARVAVIIPTKNRHDLLRPCLETVTATVPPGLADVYVVDHESDDPATVAYLREVTRRHTVLPYQGPFNFSVIMNGAVHQLPEGYTHYLFLNNDIEAPASGWLEHMLALGQRADVGIVGAVLFYPDGRVQHAGGIVGLHYAADHAYRLRSPYPPDGPGPALRATREMTVVTAACLLIRSDVFHRVGGFDEAFSVGFGDTDLCLRVRALGYKVLLDGRAVLIHHESATRGKDGTDPHPLDTQLFRARYLQQILTGDPCFSPFLSRHNELELNPFARARETVRCRTVPVVPPRIDRAAAEVVPTRRAA
jgi:GT2 family glycosyltransferase